MNDTIHLAILFHMHQPYYVEPVASGPALALLPWVRLHGASGYLDVATCLLRHPGARMTVNLVPSLIKQIEAVAAGQRDRYLELAERRMEELDLDDRAFLLTRFFSINWSRAVEPRGRYRELLDKRGRHAGADEIRRRAASFSVQELRDLTVLFNLAWLGFAVREGDEALERMENRGGGYSLDDLKTVVDKGRAACSRVLPLYRTLSERGQVELSCSAFYHPIVPLLCDSEVAREAQPHAELPARFSYREDAVAQIRMGRELFERSLGVKAAGMWPPEGSISPEALKCYAEAGTTWLCSDEGNLWRSLQMNGEAPGPRGAVLCRAYRHQGVALFFRDRDLSDRIGFRYAQDDAESAVSDLLQGVVNTALNGGQGQGQGNGALAAGEIPVVTLALDGENPWESYPDRGRPFLEALFARMAAKPTVDGRRIAPVTFSEHLKEAPVTRPLVRLAAGSWIDSDFHIWIGDPVKNRAWGLLSRARAEYARAVEAGGPSAVTPASAGAPASGGAPAVDGIDLARAYEMLLVAEGSDWFWWFGEPFHSGEDALYDRLFRQYLLAAYLSMGRPPPAELLDPVDDHAAAAGLVFVEPRAFVYPHIDGKRASYYEWSLAGCYRVPQGASMADRPDLTAITFGFDREQLYLRIEPAHAALLAHTEVGVELKDPSEGASSQLSHGLLVVYDPGLPGRWQILGSQGNKNNSANPWQPLAAGGPAAVEDSLELAVPWAQLGVRPGQRLQMVVRLLRQGRPWARYPRDGSIPLVAPDDRFEAAHWIS